MRGVRRLKEFSLFCQWYVTKSHMRNVVASNTVWSGTKGMAARSKNGRPRQNQVPTGKHGYGEVVLVRVFETKPALPWLERVTTQRQGYLRRASRPTSGLTHRGKGKSMMRRRSMRAQGSEMFRRSITFVLCQTVLWVNRVPLDHPAVPFDLGNDRGSGDRNRKCVAVNERFLFNQHIQLHSVEK